MTVYFTADTHFRHESIIRLGNRPFAGAEEMEAALVANWRDRVAPADTVYFLGDFAFTWSRRDQADVERLLSLLPGQKHLIRGNHDRKPVSRAKGWAWVGDYKRIRVEGQRIVLFHYAIRSWHGLHRGAWHLHGHSHGSLEDYGGMVMDVGVDCRDFAPVSFVEVAAYMATRGPVQVDHHAVGVAPRAITG